MDSVFQENTSTLAIRQTAPVVNLIYLCDCSGSMAGSRIATVNTALNKALAELIEFSDVYPKLKFQMAVLRFANTATWHIPPSPVEQLRYSPLVDTSGLTALGAAYDLLADYLIQVEAQASKLALPPLPPILILFSDGMPTDDVATALAKLAAQPLAQTSLRLAIGIGDQVDTAVLQAWIQAWQQQQPSVPKATKLAARQLAIAGSTLEVCELVSVFTAEAIGRLLTETPP
ncbi:vWA domain-containing protein [Thiothrix eikelboomii]|uniref:vWA domain-containing protein n=1 Tax=Thiothrix eikelboomii TaxID=92487 RepID=UPI003BB0D77A